MRVENNAAVRTFDGDSILASFNPDSSIVQSDSIGINSDSVRVAQKGDIETTIKYYAKDSIDMDVIHQIVKLYGDAKITYGNIEMEAAEIEVNYITKEIRANGIIDSTGEEIGKPVFKEGTQTYYTNQMAYNFDTKKAKIKGVVSQQGDAYMHGDNVFKNPEDELFIADAKYTTCNRAEPHFHIEAKKIKMIPNNKVLAGPFNMYVKDIWTPFGFFFGMFPMPKKRASGFIVPSYGEERRRGFFLRNGGYYWAISEYIDLKLLADVYSKGAWAASLSSTYRKRYSFNGNFNFRIAQQNAESEADSSRVNDFWIKWSHTPQSQGASRFSASVNFGSSTYNQNNPAIGDFRNSLNQDFNSSVSYSTSFRGTPFSLSLNSRLQQNINTGRFTANLPDMAFTMSRIYPFQKIKANGADWLKKLGINWTMNGTNRLTNDRLGNPGFNVVGYDPDTDSIIPIGENNNAIWQRAKNGVRHRLPLNTSIKAFKYFTFSPSFNYDEIWYFKELNYSWSEEDKAVKIDTLDKFSRVNSYNASASLNTVLYGMLYLKKGPIQAIRQVIRPGISFSWRPDFSEDRFGYYQTFQSDTLGRTRTLSKYNGFVYGTPSAGKSAAASFSLTSNLEMKVKSKKDTVTGFKKISIFDNLSFNTSYNFLADSFHLSDLRFNARTRVFDNRVNLNFNTTVDPYIYQLDTIILTSRGDKSVVQRQRDIFAWNSGKGLGQITSASITMGLNLSPKKGGSRSDADTGPNFNDPFAPLDNNVNQEEELVRDFIQNNPELYVDFNIPWTLNLNYTLNYSKRGFEESEIRQAITINGSLNITQQWKITYSSGYDFQSNEVTLTNLGLSRDLHCWQLNFNWVPFGYYQSYNLSINAKSSLLQDLKVNRNQSFFDN